MRGFLEFLKFFVVFFIIWTWTFFGQPQIWPIGEVRENQIRIPPKVEKAEALDVSAGDGLIVFSAIVDLSKWTTYTSSSDSFAASSSIGIGAIGNRSHIVRTSPTKQEAIAVWASSTLTTIQVVCYDGTSWSNEWTTSTVSNNSVRGFDVAYEASSGDVMVLYSTNASGTSVSELEYRTKSGSTGCGSANWSNPTKLDPVRTSDVVYWVKLTADRRTTSTLITAVWLDLLQDLSSMIWDGSSWGNEPGTVLETNVEKASVINNYPDVDAFDVEYESLSGDVMVVWGNAAGTNGTGHVYYATCTDGTSSCTWSATSSMSLQDDATNLDLSANPNTDELEFASIGNAGSDLQAAYWDGSSWTRSNNLDMFTAPPGAGTKLVATGWLISGGTTRPIIVYNDSAATSVSWFAGYIPVLQTDFFPSTAFGNPQKWYDIQTDPINKNNLMLTLSDVNNDLFAKRLVMDSTPTFTWTDSDGGFLNKNLRISTLGPFSFAYWNFIPSAANAPTVSGLALNNGSAITLTENTTTSVSITGTATDLNGYADLAYATSAIHRSGVGYGCSADDNNCYRLASSSCSFSGCSGNSCTVTCTANIWFFAEPTDSGTYEGEKWSGSLTVTDAGGLTDWEAISADAVELNTLLALNVTGSIDYGSLNPGEDTGAANQTTVVTATGNAAIDIQLRGTNMTFGENSISVNKQIYATSTFDYTTCAVCKLLTEVDVSYEVDLPKPTSTAAVTDDIYWGLQVPGGRPVGVYTGTDTFTVIAD